MPDEEGTTVATKFGGGGGGSGVVERVDQPNLLQEQQGKIQPTKNG